MSDKTHDLSGRSRYLFNAVSHFCASLAVLSPWTK